MCVFKNHAFIYFLRPPTWYGTVMPLVFLSRSRLVLWEENKYEYAHDSVPLSNKFVTFYHLHYLIQFFFCISFLTAASKTLISIEPLFKNSTYHGFLWNSKPRMACMGKVKPFWSYALNRLDWSELLNFMIEKWNLKVTGLEKLSAN